MPSLFGGFSRWRLSPFCSPSRPFGLQRFGRIGPAKGRVATKVPRPFCAKHAEGRSLAKGLGLFFPLVAERRILHVTCKCIYGV